MRHHNAPPKPTQKQASEAHRIFCEGFASLMELFGAEDLGRDAWRRWRLPTRYGDLELSDPDTERRLGKPSRILVSCCTAFSEPKRVPKELQANPYSGKWNHHAPPWPEDMRTFLMMVEWNIRRVLPPDHPQSAEAEYARMNGEPSFAA